MSKISLVVFTIAALLAPVAGNAEPDGRGQALSCTEYYKLGCPSGPMCPENGQRPDCAMAHAPADASAKHIIRGILRLIIMGFAAPAT
ncbi:MAG: hypothetical protein WD673_10695 [Alphaproteobacteria bacterium]